jgi:predicted RNA-binding protein with RPS1 domain
VILVSGERVKVYVLQPEDEEGRVILSLRKARAESIWQAVAEKESEGEILDAEVREQNKGGLIVNIMGLRGFLPSSQVARQFSGNLMELVGTKIPVKILEVNRKRNRLIVSQRAAQDEDRARQREELFEKLKVGDMITGKVSGLTSYGAFVNLGGADGLIHISELSWDRINNVSDMLSVGDEVRVKVIKLDPELSRISLSLRQLSDDPWDTIEDRFPPGKVVDGEVTKTKKYGAFLQIADGVEGLLHISELSWDHVERTEDILKIGEEVKVMVLSADRARRRISLSLRQLHGGGPEGPAEYVPPTYDLGDDSDQVDDESAAQAEPAAATEDVVVVTESAAELDESVEAAALPEVEGEVVLAEASGETEVEPEPAQSAGETVAAADAVMVEAEAVLVEALAEAEEALEGSPDEGAPEAPDAEASAPEPAASEPADTAVEPEPEA